LKEAESNETMNYFSLISEAQTSNGGKKHTQTKKNKRNTSAVYAERK
jgi:hypothetical protein